MNNFDRIAPFYDFLARTVFSHWLLKAQKVYLEEIGDQDRILILGGGTGKILESIRCKEIDFLEKSSEMIARASSRKCETKVNFLHVDVLSHIARKQYDLVYCPFFLDCFAPDSLKSVLSYISASLRPDGKLLVNDFRKNGRNGWLISLMYLFFEVTTNLEGSTLVSIDRVIKESNFERLRISYMRRKSIFAAIYLKK